jgi:hypothetical protein
MITLRKTDHKAAATAIFRKTRKNSFIETKKQRVCFVENLMLYRMVYVSEFLGKANESENQIYNIKIQKFWFWGLKIKIQFFQRHSRNQRKDCTIWLIFQTCLTKNKNSNLPRWRVTVSWPRRKAFLFLNDTLQEFCLSETIHPV